MTQNGSEVKHYNSGWWYLYTQAGRHTVGVRGWAVDVSQLEIIVILLPTAELIWCACSLLQLSQTGMVRTTKTNKANDPNHYLRKPDSTQWPDINWISYPSQIYQLIDVAHTHQSGVCHFAFDPVIQSPVIRNGLLSKSGGGCLRS